MPLDELNKLEEDARILDARLSREERKRERTPISSEEFLEQLAVHQEWLRTGKGTPADFSFRDLAGLNLNHLNFNRVNFYGAWFKNVSIEQSTFVKADLRSTEWQNSKVNSCNFDEALAMGMILDDAEFMNVTFKNARLMGATFTRTVLSGDITNAVYDDGALALAYLEGVMG